MKYFIFTLFLVLSILASTTPSAHADTGMGVHAGFDLGAWKNTYTQEGHGQSASIASDVSAGIKFNLGITAGIIFIDYAPEYYVAYIGNKTDGVDGEADDMDYFSLLAGNIGVKIPVIGLNPYIGGGIGNLGFNFGTRADPSGPFLRVGTTFNLASSPIATFSIRAEYQRLFLKNDEAGSLPDGYSARSDMLFLGIGFAFGK